MCRRVPLVIVLMLSRFLAPVMSAQEPGQHGWVAVTVGTAQPPADDSGMKGATAFIGAVSGKLAPRLALVAEVGTAGFDPAPRGYDSTLRALFANVDLQYSLNGHAWRPYVIGGLGIYHFGLNAGIVSHGPSEGGDNKIGANIGGGLEFLFRPSFAVLADVRYQHVGGIVAIVPFQGSFVTASVGVKRYF
jgi:opacity protein-like surface antigen